MTDMEAKARELFKTMNMCDRSAFREFDAVVQALTEAHREGMEEAAKVAEFFYPKAHTLASENADRYRIQDIAAEGIAAAIREKIKDA